jgi:hypothetical protein
VVLASFLKTSEDEDNQAFCKVDDFFPVVEDLHFEIESSELYTLTFVDGTERT